MKEMERIKDTPLRLRVSDIYVPFVSAMLSIKIGTCNIFCFNIRQLLILSCLYLYFTILQWVLYFVQNSVLSGRWQENEDIQQMYTV